jgi:adenine/guanine phosphoribosyltransferase-like PRPP-binding protein
MSSRTRPTTGYWQRLLDAWPSGAAPKPPYQFDYPVMLPDGRVLELPLRELPEGGRAVASLIANQASFTVVNALAEHMSKLARAWTVDVVVGLPTLGLTFAPGVAERLGHERYVPLGYSRKFWYDDALSEPVLSITSPNGHKRLYLDPNAVTLLEGKRICMVDDAISTGSSVKSALRLLERAGLNVAVVVVAMKQTTRWNASLEQFSQLGDAVQGVFGCPMFTWQTGGWVPIEGTLPSIP